MEDMDNNDLGYSGEETPPPEESSNRTFLIVAGILGGITVLALVCIAAYAFFVLPRQRAGREAQAATLTAQANEVSQALTSTAIAAAFTPTATKTQVPTATTKPLQLTPTPVLAIATNTAVPSADPRTQTVEALLTEAASTPQVTTTAALPTTGFADQFGLPAMLGVALLLVVVIFLARRLRTA
jgi:hypothetical protein